MTSYWNMYIFKDELLSKVYMSEKDSKIMVGIDKVGEFKNIVRVRDFEFIIDEPKSFGGSNDGPRPSEALLGSIGACLSIGFSIVAKEKEIDLDPELRVKGINKENQTGFEKIVIDVSAQGPESDFKEILEEVQKDSPVINTIEKEIEIELSI